MADPAGGVDGPAGQAPAGQRVRHLEAEPHHALCVGSQRRQPGGGVHVVAARALEHLGGALVDLAPCRQFAQLAGGQVVADEVGRQAGSHVVAARVVEKVVDAGGDLGLQHVNQLVHRTHRHVGRHRLAGDRRAQFHVDHLARCVDRLVGLERQVDARLLHDQTLVLEHAVATTHHRHAQGDVGAHRLGHLQAQLPLRGAQPLAADAIAAAGQQHGRLDPVALERHQRLRHGLGEGDERRGGVARLVAGAIEDDADAADRRPLPVAADEVAGRRHDALLRVAQGHGVAARAREAQRQAAVGDQRAAFELAAFFRSVFEAQPFPAGWLRRCVGRAVALARRHPEAHALTRSGELLRGTQLVRRAAAFDQQLARAAHPVGGAVGGQCGECVAARLVGRRQAESGAAVAVGGEFVLHQLDGKRAAVLQLAFDHAQALCAGAERDACIRDGLAVGVGQLQFAGHRLAGAEIGLVGQPGQLEMRLLIVGDAEGRGVALAAQRQQQFIATRRCVVGQQEFAVGTARAAELQGLRGHHQAGGVVDLHADVAVGQRHRLACVLELAPRHLELHGITRPVQRPVGRGVDLGVVDLAVVVEILRDEDATGTVLAEDIARLRRGPVHAQQALRVGAAGVQHAHAIGPHHARSGHRFARVAVRRPHQHLPTGGLAQRQGVADEQQRVRAVLAGHRFHQVQPRRQRAQRHPHIALAGLDELAAAAGKLQVFRWRDGLCELHRIAEALHRLEAGQRFELARLLEGGGLGQPLRCLQRRRLRGDGAARLGREQPLPRQARLHDPVVPDVRQGIAQALGGGHRRNVDPVQVALPLQERQRLGHAIDDDVDAAGGHQLLRRIDLQPHPSRFGAREAGVGEQEERLAGKRCVGRVQRRRVGRVRGKSAQAQRQTHSRQRAANERPENLRHDEASAKASR